MTFPPSAMSAPCPPEGNSGEETKETAGIEQVEAPEGNDHQAPSAASSSLLVGPTSNFSQRQTSHSVERESSVSPRLLSAIVSVKHDEWNTRWDDDSVENDVAEDGHDEEGNSIDKVIGTDVDQPTSSPALIASRSMPASLVTSCPCKSPRKVSDEGLLRSSDQGALRTPAQTSTRAQPGDPPARFGSTPNFHRKAMASSGTPGQRSLHHRKPSVPRLGMLQNAQDLASSGAVSSIVSPRRRTTEPNIQMVSESAFRPMESSSTGHADPADVTTSGEAAKSRLPHGGHLNSGVVEGCTGGEYRSLKARANSLKRVLGNLPGPRRILHALEGGLDTRKLKLTMHEKPKILMEVMPAAMVATLLALTYLVFAGGCALIVRHNLLGTASLDVPGEGGQTCPGMWTSASSSLDCIASAAGCTIFSPGNFSEGYWGIDFPSLPTTRYEALFVADFAGLSGLYGSVSLHSSFENETVLEGLPDPAVVDVLLEACTESKEGHRDFGVCESGWELVLRQENISVRQRRVPGGKGYTLFDVFQNQETIRGEVLVEQYRVQIGFVTANASDASVASIDSDGGSDAGDLSGLSTAQWSLEYERGASYQWERVTLACIMVVWVPLLVAWWRVVFSRPGEESFRNALHERKWLVWLGLSVVLTQNPVMIVGNFVAPHSPAWGLASECSLSVGISVFFVMALCIADGIGRDKTKGGATGGAKSFYVPKIIFGAVILSVMLMVDLTSFPSLTSWWDRDPLLAIQNWPWYDRRSFVWLASARVGMFLLWALWMVWRMFVTGSLLRKLPYVPTRYQQLSYRFFGLQAFLLGIVYMFFALWSLIDILRRDLGGNTPAAEFLLFMKTRQNHLGSVSVLTAYTLQLLILYLPASFQETKFLRHMAVRFVYFEEQVSIARSQSQNQAKMAGVSEGRNQSVRIPGEDARTAAEGEPGAEDRPLFCVETAAWLLEAAWETYNDPEGFENPNKYHFGVADFSRVGFELVEHIFDEEHDTHCYVLKDESRAERKGRPGLGLEGSRLRFERRMVRTKDGSSDVLRLVVAFRGSVGTKHWMDNLRFLQTEFNLEQMMPRGKEHEAPKILAEDIDKVAADKLRDVVANMATVNEEREDEMNESVGRFVSAFDKCAPSCPDRSAGDRSSGNHEKGADGDTSGVADRPDDTRDGEGHGSWNRPMALPRPFPKDAAATGMGDGVYPGVHGAQTGSWERVQSSATFPYTPSTTAPRSWVGDSSSRRDVNSNRNDPISPSGIRAILKGFKLLPWQLREPWDRKISSFSRKRLHGGGGDATVVDASFDPNEEKTGVDSSEEETPRRYYGHMQGGHGGHGPRGFLGGGRRSTKLGAHAISPRSRPRSHSMITTRVDEIKHWGLSKEAHGRLESSHSFFEREIVRRRSTSFDSAVLIGSSEEEGRRRRGSMWQGREASSGGRVHMHHPSTVMEGLGRGLGRGKDGLVRGTEVGLEWTANAARRGLEAADNAAHVMGINRIPVLRQCLWGQVHTGFWSSYSATLPGKRSQEFLDSLSKFPAVRGRVHAAVRKTVMDWLLNEDHPRDVKIYVTGHSMGGALATHCAMDLQLHTIDKIKARLGNFVRVRRTLLQRLMGHLKPPRLQPSLRRGMSRQTSAVEACSAEVDETKKQQEGHGGDGPGRHEGASGSADQRPHRRRTTAGSIGRLFPRSGSPRVSLPGGTPANESNFAPSSAGGQAEKVFRRFASSLNNVANVLDPRNLIGSPTWRVRPWGTGDSDDEDDGEAEQNERDEGGVDGEDRPRGTVDLHMYSFGAPRVGNPIYSAKYNEVVPHSFRVVVDGDPVPGVPSWWYTHVGTKVLIDGRGRGHLIIAPSFVEKRFFVRSKRFVLAHLVEAYQAGLRGNLLQAMPPETAEKLPRHWPFGVPAECDGESDTEVKEADGDEEEHGGVGHRRDSSMSSRQAEIAQHAVDALHEAEQLDRRQSFRLPGLISSTSSPKQPFCALKGIHETSHGLSSSFGASSEGVRDGGSQADDGVSRESVSQGEVDSVGQDSKIELGDEMRSSHPGIGLRKNSPVNRVESMV